MPIVAAGGTVTLTARVGHANGNPADDAALTLTIIDTPGDPVAGFPVAIPPIVRDDLGAYHYVWTVPADLPLGDYTATWDATVDGADAGGSEQVEVVEPGAITSYALLTVDQLRTFVTSSLGDEALLTLLNAAEAAIVEVAGATGEITEHIHGYGLHRIVVNREIGTITSVTEHDGGTETVLDATDYRASGYVLTRIGTGTSPRWYWAPHVVVVYTPADDAAERQRVQMELVKLDLNWKPGLTVQSVEGFAEQYAATYEQARADILATLGGGSVGMVIV